MSNRGNVLIVDDEPNAVRVLSVILKEEGYRVLESMTVDSAVGIIHSEEVDAIITDVKMPAKDGFQHDAKPRSYIYQISKRRTAFGKNYVWWIKDKLDFNKMESAAKIFVGRYDFSSFSDDDPEEKSTKVLIDNIQIKEEGDLILIRIIGSHFIWKMVRRIVGVLVEVGRGKKSEKDILNYLNAKSNEVAKFTAPPSALFLEKVLYEGEELTDEVNSIIKI